MTDPKPIDTAPHDRSTALRLAHRCMVRRDVGRPAHHLGGAATHPLAANLTRSAGCGMNRPPRNPSRSYPSDGTEIPTMALGKMRSLSIRSISAPCQQERIG